MARSSFKADDIDFEDIRKSMVGLKVPKLELADVLTELRPTMIEQRERGVSVEQLAEVLRQKGIQVGVRNLKRFIEKGELMGARPARAERTTDAGGRAAGGSDDEGSLVS
ncbi:MAG: hypothetical protein OXI64_05955 [Defluviicoccus sp.]|nr:hypothetical protein [Defluviicoccus sp.]